MKMDISMLDFFKLPATLQEKAVGKYLEYPPKNKETEFVIEKHEIGRSQHFDKRFAVNGYLVGWAGVGFSEDKPADLKKLLEMRGRGIRAEPKCYSEYCNEWKFEVYEEDGEYYYIPREYNELNIEELARQPKVWLFKKKPIGERFEFKPGEVGAGVEKPGYMTVITRGKVIFGAQEVWFHEYFLKDGKYFKDWTRLTVRAIRGARLKPGEKVPGERKERFWIMMYPKKQLPYALSKRARDKNWKPPRGIIPFPVKWAKKNFPKEYQRWLEYMGRRKEELAKTINYTLSLHKYRGPRHIRYMWRLAWYLFLDDRAKGSVRTFLLHGDPMRETRMGADYEGRDPRKYLEFQGRTKPKSRFNPNLELYGDMRILEEGRAEYESIIEKGREKVELKFKGKILKGRWRLAQEEKGSEIYVFYKEGTKLTVPEELAAYGYVYHRHHWDNRRHFDLRIKRDDYLDEFNLPKDISDLAIEEQNPGRRKKCYEVKKWFIKEGKDLVRKVGRLETKIDVLDSGKVTIIEENPQFMSMILDGKLFKKLYLVARKQNGAWTISKAELPRTLGKEGDPRKGRYFDPFEIEQKRGWDYFRVHLYDLRDFSRCEPKEKVKRYLPDLSIPAGVTPGICLFTRPGTIHGARIAYVRFDTDRWNTSKAISWIKENKLHTWFKPQIRGGQ